MSKSKSTNVHQSVTIGPSEVLAEELEEILTLNKDPAIATKLQRCLDMVTKLDSYLKSSCPPSSALKEKIWNDHFNENWEEDYQKGLTPFSNPLEMISGNYEGQFLRMIAELNKSKRILEIGLLSGYSAVSMAESPYCEDLVALEIIPFMAEFTKTRIAGTPMENKIRIIVGAASDSLVQVKEEGKKFDLVFIDADKGGYINYYKFIMDNDMLDKSGVILCDNILWYGDAYLDQKTEAGKHLYAFLQFVKNDDRVTQIICPIRDGVLMIKHKV